MFQLMAAYWWIQFKDEWEVPAWLEEAARAVHAATVP
jgi:hypothetical protein